MYFFRVEKAYNCVFISCIDCSALGYTCDDGKICAAECDGNQECPDGDDEASCGPIGTLFSVKSYVLVSDVSSVFGCTCSPI